MLQEDGDADQFGPPPIGMISGNAKATYTILETINRNLNSGKGAHQDLKASSSISSQRRDEGKQESPTNIAIDDDDDANTVIENECDNDYTNLYRSFEVEEETDEMKRKRLLQEQKQQLKLQIQAAVAPNKR